jgi:hypothetical protein
MEERESIIRLWFDMWLKQKDLGIDDIFSKDILYTESWGPEYKGIDKLKHWFYEWNTRGKVLCWDIKGYFHKDDMTAVEWYFKNAMDNGDVEEFDGVSIIKWTEDNKIRALKEFGCNINNYDPYENGSEPVFRNENINWF